MRASSSAILKDLQCEISGDVLSDEASREAYSTAACIYKIRPMAVIRPKSIEDVQITVRYAHEHEIPIIPRGGATSLAGQAVGFGIVLDLRSYLNKIIEINGGDKWVRVQPGIVLDMLNQQLADFGAFFPPDPASSDKCVVGGMIGTNAAGPHGLRYGATKDYVLSLTTVLADGEIVQFTTPDGDSASPAGVSQRAEAVLEELSLLLFPQKQLLLSRYPKVQKNSSGYNLRDAVGAGRLDATKILTGSEGTLGIVVEAKLRIAELPRAKATGLAYFHNYESMAEAVIASLPLKPAAVELMDRTLLDLARGRSTVVDQFIDDAADAMLLFEFEAETLDDASHELETLRRLLTDELRLAFSFRTNPENLGSLWEVRKEATHILQAIQSSTKKASFIEDVAVPVEKLPQYVEGLASLLRSHGLSFSIYGHAGMGNVHCEPLMDLGKREHRDLLDILATQVFDLAISLGGTLSGEHGDGFVRTPFLEKLYGREIYGLFREVKKIFDPRGIFNPGKIVAPQGASIAHDLKID